MRISTYMWNPNKRLALCLSLVLSHLFLGAVAFAQVPSEGLGGPPLWNEKQARHFGLFESLGRSQGIAIDNQGNVFYSSNYTLSKCQDITLCTRASNSDAIPREVKALGGNHIGDIDSTDGLVFAPIEDGQTYQNAFVGIFDSAELQFVKLLRLPTKLQPDGVPWIAVDKTQQVLLSSEYAKANHINIYDIKSGEAVRQIPISTELNSVQGGKVKDGFLYLSAKNSSGGSAVYVVELASGLVTKLFNVNSEVSEIEGLALGTTPDETALREIYVLALTGKGMGRRAVVYRWQRD